MAWKIVVTEEYERWFLDLNEEEQADVLAMVQVLEIRGPELGRPYADTLLGARRVRNLKELRIQHAGRPYRVFYAFDPARQAVLLCGGRKDGPKDKKFYRDMIARAEKLFLEYLEDIGPDEE